MTESDVNDLIAKVLMSIRARVNRGQSLDEALTRTIYQYRAPREQKGGPE